MRIRDDLLLELEMSIQERIERERKEGGIPNTIAAKMRLEKAIDTLVEKLVKMAFNEEETAPQKQNSPGE